MIVIFLFERDPRSRFLNDHSSKNKTWILDHVRIKRSQQSNKIIIIIHSMFSVNCTIRRDCRPVSMSSKSKCVVAGDVTTWLKKGKEHHHGPARIYYLEDGSVEEKSWYFEGKLHRLSGPAGIRYLKDGSVEEESWSFEGKLHREDAPSYIHYREDGSVDFAAWLLKGKLHRLSGPAKINYQEDGSVWWEEWFCGGKLHRLSGPAVIHYQKDGSVEWEKWYSEGKERRL